MQHTQGNTAPVPHPRPAKPDYANVFLEPAYADNAAIDDTDDEEPELGL